MMAEFDRFIFVDWSANSTPKVGEKSIWIGSCSRKNFNGDFVSLDYAEDLDSLKNSWVGSYTINPPTRKDAFSFLMEMIAKNKNEKILLGFDFGFGYPHGVYKKDTLGEKWENLWSKIYEGILGNGKKEVDRFVFANELNKTHGLFFWGKPNKDKCSLNNLDQKEGCAKKRRKESKIDNLRITDKRVRWSGVQSQWKLYGAGSVGSQSLTGIPYVEKLRKCLGEKIKVWPFETKFGDELEDFDVLICEVHFAAIPRVGANIVNKIEKSPEVKDKVQVEEMCRFFAEEDADESLLQKFLKVDCTCVSNDDRKIAQEKEGWILGVPLCLQPCDRSHKT